MASEPDLTPPAAVARNAEKGLELRRQHKRGGTQVGVARARDLAARRTLSPQTIRRMTSYFARHAVDKKGENFDSEDDPSAGAIAWLLWGGDEGRDWAERMKAALEQAEGKTGPKGD